jgi:glucosamine-6-phosphate deaminase
MALAGEQLFEETRAQYVRYHWNVAPVQTELRVAELGNSAGLIGAAYACKKALDESQGGASGISTTGGDNTQMGALPQIYVFEEATQVSKAVAREIAELIRSRRSSGQQCTLGLATGSTPIGVYKELVRMHREEGLSFADVVTFNLDEYWPMQPDVPQSYRHFMNTNLFNHIDIKLENTHVPDGTIPLEDVESFCQTYEHAISEAGGIDLQILGLGRTGHIGFNEPGSACDTRTRMVHLDPLTRQDASKDFGGQQNVPTLAVTMGVASILDARRIVLLALGSKKASITARSFEGEITEDVTASFLQNHARTEIYLDMAAASELSRNFTVVP